jgi:hypothetical protein
MLGSKCSWRASAAFSCIHFTSRCDHSHPKLIRSEHKGHFPRSNCGICPLRQICCQAPSTVGKPRVLANESQRTPSAKSGRFEASHRNPRVVPNKNLS